MISRAYHCDPPATDNDPKDIDGNANLALFEDPPIKGQERELDAADDDGVGYLGNKETFRPDDTSVHWRNPDMFSQAMINHYQRVD